MKTKILKMKELKWNERILSFAVNLSVWNTWTYSSFIFRLNSAVN